MEYVLFQKVDLVMIHSYKDYSNRRVRVFISSTFKDMQNEREILVNSVFPRLRKQFENRMVDIIDVDLRWGIPSDITEDFSIIDICIDEVDRCKPFFLGMVGSRYGYVPDSNSLPPLSSKVSDMIGDVHGISITEMEIRAGVKNASASTLSFHIRDSSEPDDDQRLTELKNKLESYGCFHYVSYVEFENQVYSVLCDSINSYFPEIPLYPFGDKFYFNHLCTLKSKNESYVQNDDFINDITSLILNSPIVYLYGSKGLGKTALISRLIYKIGEELNRDVFFHYCGNGQESSELSNIEQRLASYISHRANSDSTESRIKEMLISVDSELFVFIDAIDQLKTLQNISSVLYDISSSNPLVHIIFSGIDKICWGNFSKIMLEELSDGQVHSIVKDNLIKCGKKIEDKHIALLVGNRSCHNPLFLTAIMNLIRTYGSFDSLNQYVCNISKINTLDSIFDEIYQKLLARLSLFKTTSDVADRIMALLVYSYDGLKESEISSISSAPTVARVSVIASLELFISDYNGRLKINHDLFRDSIRKKVSHLESETHTSIIDYFSSHLCEQHSYAELFYQYLVMDEPDSIVNLISKNNAIINAMSIDRSLVIRCFNRIKSKQQKVPTVLSEMQIPDRSVISRVLVDSGCFIACIDYSGLIIDSIKGKERLSVLGDVARSEYKLGLDGFNKSKSTYRSIILEYSSIYPNDSLGLCEYRLKYAIACVSSGDVGTAIQEYCKIINTYKEYDTDDATSSWAMGNLASCYYRIGKLKQAEPLYLKSIEIRKKLYGDSSPEVAWEYCYYWSYLVKTMQYSQALNIAKSALEVYQNVYGVDSVETAWCLLNLACSQYYVGDVRDSMVSLRKSIELNDSVISKEKRPHAYSLTAYNNLSILLYTTGDHIKGKQLMEWTIKQKYEKIGLHPYTANSLISLGSMVSDRDEKMSCYLKAREILNKTYGRQSPDLYLSDLLLKNFCQSSTSIENDYVFDYSGQDVERAILSHHRGECLETEGTVVLSYNNGSELMLLDSTSNFASIQKS